MKMEIESNKLLSPVGHNIMEGTIPITKALILQQAKHFLIFLNANSSIITTLLMKWRKNLKE